MRRTVVAVVAVAPPAQLGERRAVEAARAGHAEGGRRKRLLLLEAHEHHLVRVRLLLRLLLEVGLAAEGLLPLLVAGRAGLPGHGRQHARVLPVPVLRRMRMRMALHARPLRLLRVVGRRRVGMRMRRGVRRVRQVRRLRRGSDRRRQQRRRLRALRVPGVVEEAVDGLCRLAAALVTSAKTTQP